MPDILYFSQLNAIGTIPDNKIIAIQNNPFSGSKGFKATMLEVKDYVNAGRTGGKTIDGGDATTEILLLRNNAIDGLGMDILASGVMRSNIATYEALVIDDDDIPNKKYVDDAILIENIWDRVGTTISVHNAGDDIDFSTAGLLQSAQFDSTNIAYYDSHPTFTGTTDLIDKKYVDDALIQLGEKEVLTVATPGETDFTLTAAPANPDVVLLYVRGNFYDEGFGFTISGTSLTWLDPEGLTLETTDRVVVLYNYLLGASPLSLLWQKIGNTLKPVTLTDDVEVKDLTIGKVTSGTVAGKDGVDAAFASQGVGSVSLAALGTGDADMSSVGGAAKINSANPIEITGSFDSTKPLKYDVYVAPTLDPEFAPKKYVDDHESNGVWKRIGTTISVKNVGDDVDFSTAGLVKSGTFDSANISAYNTHPVFSSDTQIVDKKYVDDTHGALNAKTDVFTATAGQTAFTLSATPSGPDAIQGYWNGKYYPNGVGFTFVGTSLTWLDPEGPIGAGDEVVFVYDFTAPAWQILDQKQVYYVGDAGNDSNNGKSLEAPFLTLAAAGAAVLAQGPGTSNNFTIKVIGAPLYTGINFTIPRNTILYAPEALIEGNITVSRQAGLKLKDLIIPMGSSGLTIDPDSFPRFIDIDRIIDLGSGSTGITVNGVGPTYLRVRETLMVSGSKLFDGTDSAGVLFFEGDYVIEGIPSTAVPGFKSYTNIKSHTIASPAITEETRIINSSSNVLIEATAGNVTATSEAAKQISLYNGTTEAIRAKAGVIALPNTPLFRVRVTSQNTSVTGNSESHKINFQTKDYDQGDHFDLATDSFTAPIAGKYLFMGSIRLIGLTSSHTRGVAELIATSQTDALFELNTAAVMTPAGDIVWNGGAMIFDLAQGNTLYFNTRVYGGATVVSVATLTWLEGYLISAT